MDDKTLARINTLIRKDIRVQLGSKERKEENKRDSILRFAKYLVSVTAHSIGVPASVRPYNTRQGYVLLYIMEIFKLNESNFRDMFTTGNLSPTTPTSKQKHLFRCKKFHSWRPEVVLRMSCPRELNQDQLDNLSVRVYLFKEDPSIKLDTFDFNNSSSKMEKSKQILALIFSKSRLNPSILIRPVNELRSVIKFRSTSVSVNDKETNSTESIQLLKKFTMACSYRNLTVLGDLRLPIRRYYCDAKVPYILRFEFWIDVRSKNRGCINCVKSSFRAAIYNGVCGCLKKKESIYMNEHSDFYGFINLKLAQLPAYPFQKKLDILSLQNKEVDSCEVICDIRNRQISDTSKLYDTQPDTQSRKLNIEFIVNHIRLYVNCLLYHCIALSTYDTQPPIQEVTLDSLFYLPAHCLINQHRMQANLSQIEDRCLRRISILLLLINLHDFESRHMKPPQIQLICRYLIAIVQNEYLTAHRPLDDKTGQDIHLFERSSTSKKLTHRRRDIFESEVMIASSFMRQFLKPRVTRWLSQVKGSQQDAEKTLTLSGMRLLKSSLAYLKKCPTGKSSRAALQIGIKQIKSDFETHLCYGILDELGARIEDAISVDGEVRKRSTGASLWLQLMLEIKFINYNLCLNWSRKGLDSILARQLSKADTSSFVKNVQGLKSVIEIKLDEYLSR